MITSDSKRFASDEPKFSKNYIEVCVYNRVRLRTSFNDDLGISKQLTE